MRSVPRAVLAGAAAAAGAALAVAFGAEWWGGLVPCPLCLVERWPYRAAIAFALIGLVLPASLRRAALALVLLAGLGAVAAAGVHVGVEFGFWPSPLPECAAPRLGSGSIAERLRNMPERPAKPCDEGVYPIAALPISFAQANLLYALAFSAAAAGALISRRRR
jgi:disulfide bond formation protein DsbB